MVGMESRKLNSSAAGRDRPATWPDAMVDMEREVPGKTAERVWQSPIQMAWPRLMSSTLLGARLMPIAPCVNHPHHNAADEHGPGNHRQAAQVLVAPFVQQQRRNGGHGKGNQRERDGMGQPGACAVFTLGKSANETDDAPQKEQNQRTNRAQSGSRSCTSSSRHRRAGFSSVLQRCADVPSS